MVQELDPTTAKIAAASFANHGHVKKVEMPKPIRH